MAKRGRAGMRAVGSDEPLNGHGGEPATEPAESRRGFSVPVDANGRAQWSRMKESTRRDLRELLTSDPEWAKELGAEATGSAATLDAATVGVLWGAIGIVMATAAKASGYPDDQAATLRFSPEETEVLSGPTLRVLNKYSPSMGKYEDEIMLAVTAASIVGAKFAALKKPARVIDIATGRNVTSPTEVVPEPAS